MPEYRIHYDLRKTEIPAVLLAKERIRGMHPSCISLEDYFKRGELLSFIFEKYKDTDFLKTVSEQQIDEDYNIQPAEYFIQQENYSLHIIVENNFTKPTKGSDYFDDLFEETITSDIKDGEDITRIELNFFHDNSPQIIKEIGEAIKKLKPFAVKNKTQGKLNLITQNPHGPGFDLKPFTLVPVEVDLGLNYGDEFPKIHEYILEQLETTNKGIVFFHGAVGSGKTRYISYLTSQIKDKRVIYLTPDFINELANPQFISFLMDYPNSILVIEDGENVLKSRKRGENQSIANLLNMTDGLLGECLKFQIICTFNCRLDEIDPALLRKGRMIARHEFKALPKEKAQELSDKLGFQTKITKDTTLTDIYNQKKKDFAEEGQEIRRIGFNTNKDD